MTELKSRKGSALLCYLAVTGNPVTRSRLAGLFWPDMLEGDALMNLRKVLYRLKGLAHYLVITHETLAFDLDSSYQLDVTEFENQAARRRDIPCLQAAAESMGAIS